MKKEIKEVVVLDDKDVERARTLAKTLIESITTNKDVVLDQDKQQLIHDTICFLEDIEYEFNN